MPALKPTGLFGTVTWIGTVHDRGAALVSASRSQIMALFTGPQGDAHAGLTRPSCSRVKSQYPLGTTIRNTRQFSLVSAQELALIAQQMGLTALDPALLGATMVVDGIADFTHLPPASRLQAPSGATLVVDMANRPCTLPAREIEAIFPGAGKRFKPVATGRRGVTAWVEREGIFLLGDRLDLHIPDQRAWSGPA